MPEIVSGCKKLLARLERWTIPYLIQGREGDTLGDRLGKISEKADIATSLMSGGADTMYYTAEKLFDYDKKTTFSDKIFYNRYNVAGSRLESVASKTLGRFNGLALPAVHALLWAITATEPKLWPVLALSIASPGLNHLKNIAEKNGQGFEAVYASELKQLPGSYPVKMESTGKHGYVFKAIQNTKLIIGEEQYRVPAGRVFVQEDSGKGKVLTKENFEKECRFDRNTNPTLGNLQR